VPLMWHEKFVSLHEVKVSDETNEKED